MGLSTRLNITLWIQRDIVKPWKLYPFDKSSQQNLEKRSQQCKKSRGSLQLLQVTYISLESGYFSRREYEEDSLH
jgi:hypothetical protein